MKRLLIALALFAAPVSAQSPNWLPGVYTLAAGPDNIYTNLSPVAYAYNIAWVVDRPGGAGFMASNGTAWVSDQGVPGTPGADGRTVLSGVGSPSGGLGSNGDFYMDLSVYRLYGPKTSGVWGTGFSLIGPTGTNGATGATGATGPAGPSTFGSPNSRSVSLATAYQATDNTKPAIVTVNLSSTASISLTGGTTNGADVVIGSTNGVAGGTGTQVCKYANSNTGALTIGLNLSTISGVSCSFALPVGWYFAVRQTSGTVTVTSTYDQSTG